MLSVFTINPTYLFSITLFHPKVQVCLRMLCRVTRWVFGGMPTRWKLRLHTVCWSMFWVPMIDLNWKEGWLVRRDCGRVKADFVETGERIMRWSWDSYPVLSSIRKVRLG